MSDFTASNGITVSSHGGNWNRTTIRFEGKVPGLVKEFTNSRGLQFEDPDFVALDEYLQHKRDERLGRWRWPANPDYVVYPNDNGSATVVQESSPTAALTFWENLRHASVTSGAYMDAARAYFCTHPEPKPWHEAKPGEVWELSVRDIGEGAYVAGDYTFIAADHGIPLDSDSVIDGRRIYPEVAS